MAQVKVVHSGADAVNSSSQAAAEMILQAHARLVAALQGGTFTGQAALMMRDQVHLRLMKAQHSADSAVRLGRATRDHSVAIGQADAAGGGRFGSYA